MAAAHLPKPYEAGAAPTVAPPHSPAPRTGAGPSVHAGGTLRFSDDRIRDHWWAVLSPRVRERMTARAGGEIVEWWAQGDGDGRPHGVVLGPRGLVLATPTVNASGGAAHVLLIVPLDSASFRHVEVATGPPAGSSPPSGGPGPSPGMDPGLDGPMRDVLGNLPGRAQILLQSPFLPPAGRLRADYYYYRQEINATEVLYVWCYLADSRSVTFAAGVRTQPLPLAAHAFRPGDTSWPEHLVSWRVICRQALVSPGGRHGSDQSVARRSPT